MRRPLRARMARFLFCLTLLTPAIALSDNAGSSMKPSQAIPFSLPDPKGLPHKLSQWKNHVIVLNFWATWCPPCLKEIPEFIKLQEKFGAKGLQFIGIAIDDASEVENFVEMHDVNYPVLVGEAEASDIAFLYGNHLGVLPFSVVIDRKGMIVSRHKGELTPEKLEEIILPLL
ncbi:MAG: TlpA family protein disulfide reductase [Gammaproteobacteria bacterium]|nr:MAG: TlpA family protein disulfide reductase [Gammaproteobacteria bacterium]RLA18664.1 MAG: TlpA family protein disulfide reductase [Gammaproteobacteria bacterium]